MLKPGQKCDHFEILGKLGEGGMGAVYLARDSKLNRKVALKVLTSELFEDQVQLEMLCGLPSSLGKPDNRATFGPFDVASAASQPYLAVWTQP